MFAFPCDESRQAVLLVEQNDGKLFVDFLANFIPSFCWEENGATCSEWMWTLEYERGESGRLSRCRFVDGGLSVRRFWFLPLLYVGGFILLLSVFCFNFRLRFCPLSISLFVFLFHGLFLFTACKTSWAEDDATAISVRFGEIDGIALLSCNLGYVVRSFVCHVELWYVHAVTIERTSVLNG